VGDWVLLWKCTGSLQDLNPKIRTNIVEFVMVVMVFGGGVMLGDAVVGGVVAGVAGYFHPAIRDPPFPSSWQQFLHRG
jgi:branched-subunit amino acid ABC-type transport system permease component